MACERDRESAAFFVGEQRRLDLELKMLLGAQAKERERESELSRKLRFASFCRSYKAGAEAFAGATLQKLSAGYAKAYKAHRFKVK